MPVSANRRRFLALLSLVGAAAFSHRATAQFTTPPGPDTLPGDPAGTTILDIGNWRMVSVANQSRAFIADETQGLRSAIDGPDEARRGGSAELLLEYWSVPPAAFRGTMTINAVAGGLAANAGSNYPARVLLDGVEIDSFTVDEQVKKDVVAWFGPKLEKLAAARRLTVMMTVRGEERTIYDMELSGTAELLGKMPLIPNYNYNVRGLGRPGPSGGGSRPSGGSGSCFITTACCGVVGLDDDCFELAALRRFRDEVMAATEDGRADIVLYYETAPKLLDDMAGRGEQKRLLALYFSHILPSAVLARLGFRVLPRRIYTHMMAGLMARYR
jgi:hypothetical protein